MGINRFEYFGKIKFDLSNDTVTPQTLLEGITAHNNVGDLIVGIAPQSGSSLSMNSGYVEIVSDTDLRDRPFIIEHGLHNSPALFLLTCTSRLAKWCLVSASYISSNITGSSTDNSVYRTTGMMSGNAKIDVSKNPNDIVVDDVNITINTNERVELQAGSTYLWIAVGG